ncbi:8-amino-7-oxononanoate synthase [Paenibacillus montanisoli]|uniref:8-amino-7-ketopelargonate synthase n=1 Tax=Paenibacillus montanisoli TaxID=2081970 RepID=A0A328U391_9BACL|nr:8-amino-7-oxononanoate synthase [Paenibacillus montanisoli]RAP77278.1 8-amino-7-oxononanoate synthase [Paenibacillus montanisoli]
MNWMEKELERLSGQSLERFVHASEPARGFPGYLIRGDRRLLNLSSNDYLGLSGNREVVEAMRLALEREEAGSGASRLVTGSRQANERLEQALAAWQQSEAALVFANGYMANVGVISALAGRGDVIFSDRLNHASIVDGIRLSRAEHVRYRHNDPEHLNDLLQKHRHARRKWMITDSVFSMDGDKALLHELVELKKEHGALLMVDEAHSGGIYGHRGEGLANQLGLHKEVDVHMGTFSKAFGVYGAYVSGSSTLIRWLINKTRSLIYSTALPPAVIAGVEKALTIVQEEKWRRDKLAASIQVFRSALAEAGFTVGRSDSPIIPVIVGDNESALRFSSILEDFGILAAAIRPPTVPEGTARLRFSLSVAHAESELLHAADRIRQAGMYAGVLKE